MKILSAIFVLAIGSVCFAETNMLSQLDQGSFWATFYASKLAKSDSFGSLLKNLPLSKKNHELALKYGDRVNAEFIQPEIDVSGSILTLKFPAKTLSLDFDALGEGKLKLNGSSVVIDSNKTFLNYKTEAFLIISRKQASNIIFDALVPSAYAKDNRTIDERMAAYVATLFSRASTEHLSDRRDSNVPVADWIIRAYVSNVKMTQTQNAEEDTDAYLPSQYTFTCKDGRLETLTEAFADVRGSFRKIPTGWEFEENGQKIQTDNATKITTLIDGNLKWKTQERRILKVGTNLLPKTTGYTLGYAPLHFSQCCRQAGCPEVVKSAMRAAQQRLQSDPKGQRSAR